MKYDSEGAWGASVERGDSWTIGEAKRRRRTGAKERRMLRAVGSRSAWTCNGNRAGQHIDWLRAIECWRWERKNWTELSVPSSHNEKVDVGGAISLSLERRTIGCQNKQE